MPVSTVSLTRPTRRTHFGYGLPMSRDTIDYPAFVKKLALPAGFAPPTQLVYLRCTPSSRTTSTFAATSDAVTRAGRLLTRQRRLRRKAA
jgi:hypothetical protein